MKYVEPFADTLNSSTATDYFGLSGQAGRHALTTFRLRMLLEEPDLDEEEVEEFAENLAKYLGFCDYNCRILLYLPFAILRQPNERLREIMREGWVRLSRQADARENFNLGDTLEPECRICNPNDPTDFGDGLSRVVKIAHLLPWLIRYKYFSVEEVIQEVRMRPHDLVFASSILDTLPVLKWLGVVAPEKLLELKHILGQILPPPTLMPPPIVTPAREAWLRELIHHEPVTLKNLTGPMMQNFDEAALPTLDCQKGELLRFGGSRLKGYGRPSSDFDVWPIQIGAPATANPGEIHLIFNTVWGGENASLVRDEQLRHVLAYLQLPPSKARTRCLEKLEQDRLQYRLMHKGFPYAMDDISLATRDFGSIDGSSAFYDDRYRTIATELFLTYVFLPSL